MADEKLRPLQWLIWSNEHRAWWGPGRHGYTTNTDRAGRYSEDAAKAICENANAYLKVSVPPNEVMVLAPRSIRRAAAMSISHPETEDVAGAVPFVFATLLPFSCSICAPLSWDQARIEEFAQDRFPGEPWETVDKSILGWGSPTPNQCNQMPERQHWFLLRGLG